MPSRDDKKYYKLFDFNRYYKDTWLFGVDICHEEDETYLMIYLFKFYIAIGKIRDYDRGIEEE